MWQPPKLPLILLVVVLAQFTTGLGLSVHLRDAPAGNASNAANGTNRTEQQQRAQQEVARQQVGLVCNQLKSIAASVPNPDSNASKALKAIANETCTALNKLSDPSLSKEEKQDVVRDVMRSRLEWARKLTDIMEEMRKETAGAAEAEAEAEATPQHRILVAQVVSKLGAQLQASNEASRAPSGGGNGNRFKL